MKSLKIKPVTKFIAPPALQEKIDAKIAFLRSFENEIPGIIVIHNIRDFSIVHMSEAGLKTLKTTIEEIKTLGLEYYQTFLSPDSYAYLQQFMDAIYHSREDDDLSFIQQARSSRDEEWKWYASNSKIFLKDEAGVPLLSISYIIPITGKQFFESRIQRVFDEHKFLKENKHLFDQLTQREKEILGLMALSISSEEIAEKKHISKATVDTHRRNIRRKIGFENPYEIISFARAFNLI